MTSFTKKAIRDSFLKLLNEKPLSQITIRDIVDDCGINRNTFYYHYHDITHLLQSIADEEADRIIQSYPTLDSLEECLNAITCFALENRKAVLHIYRSVKRDLYEQHQWQICTHVITNYVDRILSGRTVPETDRKLIIDYFKCVCFGLVIGWLEGGLKDDLPSRIHRLCELKQGALEQMISRCEKTE